MKQNFLLIVILLWTTTATTTETEVSEKYIFSQDQVNLASEIIDKLESNHLVKKDYRAVKSDSFEIFIDRLDPNKNIFTTSEVATVFKDINANSTITNDLEIAFFLFNNYVTRYKQRYKTVLYFVSFSISFRIEIETPSCSASSPLSSSHLIWSHIISSHLNSSHLILMISLRSDEMR